MATLNCGTINFGDDVFVNTRPHIRDLASRIREGGEHRPSSSATRSGHIEEALALLAEGAIAHAAALPVRARRARGHRRDGGERDSSCARSCRRSATWGVAAVGRHQQPMTELAMRSRRARARRAGGQHLPVEGRALRGERAARRARGGVRAVNRAHARRAGSGANAPRCPPSERRVTVCTRTLVADGLTPVAAYATLRQADPERASFLFESVVAGDRWGRYSILGYRPRYDAILGAHGWTILGDANVSLDAAGDPLAAAEPLFRATDAGTPGGNPAAKLARASFGYLAWDLGSRDREGARLERRDPGDPCALPRWGNDRRVRRARADRDDRRRARRGRGPRARRSRRPPPRSAGSPSPIGRASRPT